MTGFGFIGQNLYQKFSSSKCDVNIIGRFNKIKNYHLDKRILNFDIYNLKELKKLKLEKSIIVLSILDSDKKNFKKKFKKLIFFLRKHNVSKLILLSSVSVYGNNYRKILPINEYAKNCLFAENVTKKYFNKTLIFRVANLFGIYKKNPGTIEKLVMTNLKIKNFIFSNDKTIRSYISINELFNILHTVIIKKDINGTYDVSNKNYIFSMKELIEIFRKYYKKKINYNQKIKPDKISQSIISSQKLQKKLNIQNMKDIVNEIKKIDYFYKKYRKKIA